MGEFDKDVGNVAGDCPVVVCFDGDVIVGAADDGGHDGAHGTDKLFVDEVGDLLDVEFVLSETHACEDLLINKGHFFG